VPRSLITLTTDFGDGSPYVAILQGVILRINPDAGLVDASHGVAPQDVQQGALLLEKIVPWFPAGTIHVCVVDPGVGSDRRILYAHLRDQHFVLPDNGLISNLASRWPPSKMIDVSNRKYWLGEVSATFHGRDIMAPVAAHLSLGVSPQQLGNPCDDYVTLHWPQATSVENKIQGQVVSVDSFGNLITNITREMLQKIPADAMVTVRCDEHETQGIFQTYADQPALTLIALVGSDDQLELAIVNESARDMLAVGVGAGDPVAW